MSGCLRDNICFYDKKPACCMQCLEKYNCNKKCNTLVCNIDSRYCEYTTYTNEESSIFTIYFR